MLPRLAYVCEKTNVYFQDVLLGIVDALEKESLFQLQTWQGHRMIPAAALQYVSADAVVTTSWDWDGLPGLPRNTPVIGISNAKAVTDFARIVNDDHAVGRIAAEAMADAGYERLLILKNQDLHHARLRCEGVVEVAKKHNLPLQVHDLSLPKPLPGETFGDVLLETRRALAARVEDLLPGTGILAVQSNAASEFSGVFDNHSHLRIPAEVGLLVMDQNPQEDRRMACIELNGREIGRRAVRGLYANRQNETALTPGSCMTVPPLGVRVGKTLRQGEGVLLYQKLCLLYQSGLADTFHVENVALKLGLSRRSLEMKLKAARLPAPYELLTRLRLQRAEELLQRGDMSIEEIAETCGFANGRSLTERFQAHHGMTPFAYRRQARAGSPR
ncbi:MAG: helix-turn-helix domain-containing protein [Verrucomicrobia bacterium]|nr:helix-turn-helix domain-containing protein [Verrucomicrobiota bacterium]MCH8525743.1 helix-turn-helix domain-containing protein [Kiritimatiellia bacterium]